MSRFLVERLQTLAPYVPGEQPQDQRYVKLNTNESPLSAVPTRSGGAQPADHIPAEPVSGSAGQSAVRIHRRHLCPLSPENVFVGNGSDEVLAFAFMAYGDARGFAYPEISYGFYKVYARLYGLTPTVVPLNKDFTVPAEKFCNLGMPIAIANPNAPTSLAHAAQGH